MLDIREGKESFQDYCALRCGRDEAIVCGLHLPFRVSCIVGAWHLATIDRALALTAMNPTSAAGSWLLRACENRHASRHRSNQTFHFRLCAHRRPRWTFSLVSIYRAVEQRACSPLYGVSFSFEYKYESALITIVSRSTPWAFV